MVDNSGTSALISGGTQGLGMAVAECLIRQGCTQADHHRPERGPRRSGGGAAFATAARTACSCLAMWPMSARARPPMAAAISHHGHVNALVNSAADTSRGSLTDTPAELFDRHMAINLRGPFFMMQGVVRHLLETGKPGSMVNILSTSAHVGQSFLSAYSTSKGGLVTLTKNTANAYRTNLIRCNGVAPGWMDTPGEHVVQQTFPRRARRLAGNGRGRASDGPAGQACTRSHR